MKQKVEVCSNILVFYLDYYDTILYMSGICF